MRAFLKGCVTDAQGRPEPKMILGVLFLLLDFVYAVLAIASVAKWDTGIFTAVSVLGGGLVGVTAVTDAITDAANKGA